MVRSYQNVVFERNLDIWHFVWNCRIYFIQIDVKKQTEKAAGCCIWYAVFVFGICVCIDSIYAWNNTKGMQMDTVLVMEVYLFNWR